MASKWSNIDAKDFDSNGNNYTGERFSINQLHPSQGFVNVLGIIIGKWNSRSFMDKNGCNRSCFSFLLRDSHTYFIYITFWGTCEEVEQTEKKHKIGDLVEILCAQIVPKTEDFNEFKYKPWTPTPFHLSVKSKQGQLVLLQQDYGLDKSINPPHDNRGIGMIEELDIDKGLIRCPTKTPNDFYTVTELHANGDNINGDSINIVAVVKRVYGRRNLTLKATREVKAKCDLLLCDERMHCMYLTIWENDLIEWAEKWAICLPIVVFLADVRLKYDDFKKEYTIHSTAKTVMTFDPDIPDLKEKFSGALNECVYKGKNVSKQDSNFSEEIEMDTSKYQTLMTVSGVKSLISELIGKRSRTDHASKTSIMNFYQKSQNKTNIINEQKGGKFHKTDSGYPNQSICSDSFALSRATEETINIQIIGYLTFFDVDCDLVDNVIAWICDACQNKVNLRKSQPQNNSQNNGSYNIPSSFSVTQWDDHTNKPLMLQCTNPYCTSAVKGTTNSSSISPIYDIRVHIGDKTGTLKACHFIPQLAKAVIGAGEQDFMRSQPDEKTQIKWNYLFEPFQFLIKLVSQDNRSPQIKVVGMQAIDP